MPRAGPGRTLRLQVRWADGVCGGDLRMRTFARLDVGLSWYGHGEGGARAGLTRHSIPKHTRNTHKKQKRGIHASPTHLQVHAPLAARPRAGVGGIVAVQRVLQV